MFRLFSSDSGVSEYKKVLKPLKTAALTVKGELYAEQISHSFDISLRNLESDLKALKNNKELMFPTDKNAGATNDALVQYLREWALGADAPSMMALVIRACDHFDIHEPDLVQMTLMAAILGGIDHDLPYHNTAHFKKVVIQTMRLISVHNEIYDGTSRVLNEEQMATLLTSACIHDLGHDGLGNAIKGVFYTGRLERYSYDLAAPYLKEAGASEETLQTIKTLLLVTDVSPLGDLTNPMYQMKAAYKFHFMGDKDKLHRLNLSDELEALEKDSDLALLGCLLHEADIATSAGLSYAVTQYETCLFRKEIKAEDARPIHIIDFLNKVCQRRFLSDAGQKLFGANLARILVLAEDQDKHGNEPFPESKHTDFILGIPGVEHAKDKTLN